ncbi:MAG TPA: hypothetical protein VHQ68_15025 [Propionibacteriaceae bacterium]|nr:hypothetical protein [Propionibacteriaceae bacterium]
MPATRTTTTETLTISPPSRPPRVGVIAAGLVVFAAAALTPWLLAPSSQTETSPMTPPMAAAPPQLASALGQGGAAAGAGSVPSPKAYLMFCENSPSLCALPTAATGYIQFCWNSPTLCTMPKSN